VSGLYSYVFKYSAIYFCLIFISDCFTRQILKISSDINFAEICPVGAELIREDRRTEKRTGVKDPIGAFRDSANAPKNDGEIFTPLSPILSECRSAYFWKTTTVSKSTTQSL